MENPETDLAINTLAQLQILEACRHYNPEVRVVFASTRQVYGRPLQIPVNEDHPLAPVDLNGVHKLAAEQYHQLFNNIYGIRSVILRLTNTFGPRMRVVDARQTFLGIWIRRVLEGKPILIFGDGEQIRDYNYIDDVVDALLLAANTDQCCGEVLNLGSSEAFSLTETAKVFKKNWCRKAKLNTCPSRKTAWSSTLATTALITAASKPNSAGNLRSASKKA